MSQNDPNEELKKLIRNIVQKEMGSNKSSVVTQSNVQNIPHHTVTKRGYHYINLPEGVTQIKYKLIGGGGGSGGGGSGGCSTTSLSGGGGGGGGGSGDAEHISSVYDIDIEQISVERGCIIAYVGRGGEGGKGGKAVSPGSNGENGTPGKTGLPSFLFLVKDKKAVDIHSDELIPVSTINTESTMSAYYGHGNAYSNPNLSSVSATFGPADAFFIDYAHGGYPGGGGFGGGMGGTGGTGGYGNMGWVANSSGGGGGGGGTGSSLTDISNAPGGAIYWSGTNYISRYHSAHGMHNGTTGSTGNTYYSGGVLTFEAGFGGDGGNSLWNTNDLSRRSNGFGGFGHDDEGDGIDFIGDPDPEPLYDDSSDDLNNSCEDSEERYGIHLGGGGGAGSGRDKHRNGANTTFPRKEMCDCEEIIFPGDGKCVPKRPTHPGSGVGGGSGGSGMYTVTGTDHQQKSGKGGNGCRGADGKVSITFLGTEEFYTWTHLNNMDLTH